MKYRSPMPAAHSMIILIMTALLTMVLPSALYARDMTSVAMVTGISKKLIVTRAGKDVQGKVGMDLFEGDLLKTGEGCRAVILMGDGSEIKLNQKTEMTIKAYNDTQKNLFVRIGEIFGKFLPQETRVILETPRGIAGIEGTEFTLKVDDSEGMVNVNEGKVSVGNDRKVMITKDQCCAFKSGTPGEVLKAKFPEWHKDLKEYGNALKEVIEETNLGEAKKRFEDYSEPELQNLQKKLAHIGTELHEIQAPDFMEPFHREILKINEMAEDMTVTAIKVKNNPGRNDLKAELDRKQAAMKQERTRFLAAVRSSVMKWNQKLKQFRQNYGKTAPSRGRLWQQKFKQRQQAPDRAPQEN